MSEPSRNVKSVVVRIVARIAVCFVVADIKCNNAHIGGFAKFARDQAHFRTIP
jgi:hypothetical protein